MFCKLPFSLQLLFAVSFAAVMENVLRISCGVTESIIAEITPMSSTVSVSCCHHLLCLEAQTEVLLFYTCPQKIAGVRAQTWPNVLGASWLSDLSDQEPATIFSDQNGLIKKNCIAVNILFFYYMT